MARPKKYNLPMPESATDALNAAERANRAADDIRTSVKIPLPNGKFGTLDLFIDNDYRSGNYTSIFSDPSKFMKEVNPDCIYAWVAFHKGSAESSLGGKIRSGAYRPVREDEIHDNFDLPIMTHKAAGETLICVYDVALVEVQPQAVKRLYKWREQQAVTKTVRNAAYEFLKSRVEADTGGAARVEMDIKDTNIG